jgi:hypothetical protein
MKDWTNEELQQMLLKIAQRAAVDTAFRALALQDGAAAILQVSAKPLPNGITYRFVDNSGPVKTVPLPDPVLCVSDELSETELENVAGGSGTPSPPVSGGWSKIAALQRSAKRANPRA